MKVTYTIPRDRLQPPVRSKELAAFTWMLQKPGGLEILATAGISVPDIFEIIHHTNPDDPPDFSALGHGFEVTEFPPNQSAVQAVYMQGGGAALAALFPSPGRDYSTAGKVLLVPALHLARRLGLAAMGRAEFSRIGPCDPARTDSLSQ